MGSAFDACNKAIELIKSYKYDEALKVLDARPDEEIAKTELFYVFATYGLVKAEKVISYKKVGEQVSDDLILSAKKDIESAHFFWKNELDPEQRLETQEYSDLISDKFNQIFPFVEEVWSKRQYEKESSEREAKRKKSINFAKIMGLGAAACFLLGMLKFGPGGLIIFLAIVLGIIALVVWINNK